MENRKANIFQLIIALHLLKINNFRFSNYDKIIILNVVFSLFTGIRYSRGHEKQEMVVSSKTKHFRQH